LKKKELGLTIECQQQERDLRSTGQSSNSGGGEKKEKEKNFGSTSGQVSGKRVARENSASKRTGRM